VDVPHAVTVATSALTRIAELLPAMRGLPVDHALIGNVGLYAGALAFIHAMYAVEVKPPEGMEELYQKLLKTRTLLRLDANNLAIRGLINEASLSALSGETGFQNVPYDVLSLVTLHAAVGSRSAGRTAVSAEELQQARTDASQFLNVLGQREQQLKARTELNEQRRRAFTLLTLAYDEARRAVSFLLWRETEKHLPSLYFNRGARKAQPGPASDLPANPASPSGAPGSSVPGSGAPGGAAPSGAVPSTNSVDAVTQVGLPTVAIPAGARGGNPFAAS
jgi:hypothetical protein